MVRVKWRRQPISQEEMAEFVKDYNEGMPLKKMQEKYNISRAAIYLRLKKAENE